MAAKSFVFLGYLCLSQADPLYPSTTVCEAVPSLGSGMGGLSSLGNLGGMNHLGGMGSTTVCESTPNIGVSSYGYSGVRSKSMGALNSLNSLNSLNGMNSMGPTTVCETIPNLGMGGYGLSSINANILESLPPMGFGLGLGGLQGLFGISGPVLETVPALELRPACGVGVSGLSGLNSLAFGGRGVSGVHGAGTTVCETPNIGLGGYGYGLVDVSRAQGGLNSLGLGGLYPYSGIGMNPCFN